MTLAEIEAAAARWLLKRDDGEWTPADQAELDRWLRASPSHRVSFIRLGSLWRKANQLKSLAGAVPRGQVPPRYSLQPRRAFSGQDLTAGDRRGGLGYRKTAVAAFAAGLVLLLAVGLHIGLHGPATYSTDIGGFSRIRTADGSTIELNTATEIKVTITPTRREIELVRGEAFFEVAKDAARPFTVYAHQHRITALGTQFSVWSRVDSIQVSVVDGSVGVLLAASRPKSPDSTILTAGTITEVGVNRITPRAHDTDAMARSLAWRQGYINLVNTSLSEAVAELNRYSTRQIVIADPALESIKVGGNFRMDNVEACLRSFEILGIHSERQDGRIILTLDPHSHP